MMIAMIGRQRAGKDYAAKVLAPFGFTRVAFADPMRKALYDLNPLVTCDEWTALYLQDVVDAHGWDVAKEEYPEVRRLLQRFGTEMGRNNFGPDVWVDLAARAMPKGDVVITDCRFRNELEWVKRQGGVVVRVERPSLGEEDLSLPRYSHASERDWREWKPDAVVVNDDTFTYAIDVALLTTWCGSPRTPAGIEKRPGL